MESKDDAWLGGSLAPAAIAARGEQRSAFSADAWTEAYPCAQQRNEKSARQAAVPMDFLADLEAHLEVPCNGAHPQPAGLSQLEIDPHFGGHSTLHRLGNDRVTQPRAGSRRGTSL